MLEIKNDYYIDMFKIPLIHISAGNWIEKKQFLTTMMKDPANEKHWHHKNNLL